MVKGKHFFGKPVYGQIIKYLKKDNIVEMSRNHGGERYIKSFDRWHQLLTAYPQPLIRISLGRIERVLKPSLQLLSGALLPGSRNLPAR